MSKNIDQITAGLSTSRQKTIKARASEIIALEMTMQELRKKQSVSQESLAKILGISQDGVSRIERRSDLMLSTLQDYIKALGGSLHIIARFPGTRQVRVKRF